ncbi:MAG: bifunctional folylpolyglutamate synthase/dihydrofolate synthase [Gemmatimonadota bacterium]
MSEYREALAALQRLERFGIRLGLEEVRAYCEAAGHPELACPTLHVGGTNGKGTTAACLAAIGTAHGLRTGCYTSPHVLDFRERIRVDGEPIAREAVVDAWRRVADWSRVRGLTYFEATTLMAFEHFAATGVELAVVEVGLGGRLDATNVVQPEIAVVTNVARDHEPQLGRDLTAIAREKAGIFKAGIPALVGEAGTPEVRDGLVESARETGAPIGFLEADVRLDVRLVEDGTRFDYAGPDWRGSDLALPIKGAHFARDAALAVRAWERATVRPLAASSVREALGGVRPVGRAERWVVDGIEIVFDVAHNPAAIGRLTESLTGLAEGSTLVVAGFLADKDWSGMLERLSSLGGRGWLCGLTDAPPDRRLGRPPGLGRWPWIRWADSVAEGLAEARREAAGGQVGRILVTGSFHTVGDAMRALGRSGPGSLYRVPAAGAAR